MRRSKKLNGAMAVALSGAAVLGSSDVLAAGFALLEQNTSGLGNAYAGAAAVAEDASTIFFNSAGLAELKHPSLVLNGSVIMVNSDFKNSGSQAALGHTLGSTGGDAGGTTPVPAFYMGGPLTDRIAGGIGVNAPFGLKTEFTDDWLGRFQGILSDVKTTNINTALAFKLNNVVSIGVGANHQTLDAKLTKNVNYTAVIGGISPASLANPANLGLQGRSTVKGDDSAWGYDVGVLFNFNDHTRIGLSYRSAFSYNIDGNAHFAPPTSADPTGQAIIAGATATTLANGPVTLEIKLPATARLAMTQKLGSSVELLGEVSWTQWSDIKELRIKRPSGVTLSNTPEDWDDVMRYALGANFQLNDAVKLRVGAAMDESPVPDSTRTPRLADSDRTWMSAGAKFRVSNNINLDLGYTYIKVDDAPLNQNDGNTALNGLINGEQQTDINIVGVQATVSF